ncbi:hypothetical protein Francci3_2349 [Frankia casuarinae]|uniref:Uncharacterized protein n=2 Tax=Frankiaceae TaxID=74712 RepID=Q2JAH6_FRACC|nr:hypothetical protein Francci3_2349 [Frankia casuarinae]
MTPSASSSSAERVRHAWQERTASQARLRIADRSLGRVALAAAREDAAMGLPLVILSDPTVRGALDAARLHAPGPYLHEGRWELADVIDLYVCGDLPSERLVEILAIWPYQAHDPHRDEAQPWSDSFAVVEAAGDAGLLPRPLVAQVRRHRSDLT